MYIIASILANAPGQKLTSLSLGLYFQRPLNLNKAHHFRMKNPLFQRRISGRSTLVLFVPLTVNRMLVK